LGADGGSPLLACGIVLAFVPSRFKGIVGQADISLSGTDFDGQSSLSFDQVGSQ